MNPLDIIVCAVMIYALWHGWRSGILRQLSGIAGLLVGVWAANRFSEHFAQWMSLEGESKEVAFICTVIVVLIAVILLLHLLDRLLSAGGLSLPIRGLGACISMVKCVLLLSLMLTLYTHARQTFSPKKDALPVIITESYSYPLLLFVSETAFPYLQRTAKELFKLTQKEAPDAPKGNEGDSLSQAVCDSVDYPNIKMESDTSAQ